MAQLCSGLQSLNRHQGRAGLQEAKQRRMQDENCLGHCVPIAEP